MTRAELMRRISVSEFFEWMALERVEPFGDRRGDFQAAIVASTTANMFQPPGAKQLSIEEFLLKFRSDEPPQTPEQQLQLMLTIQAAQNAIVRARGGLD